MVQTTAGAKKMVAKLRKKHGKDYFKELGAKGGKVKRNRPQRNKLGQWVK